MKQPLLISDEKKIELCDKYITLTEITDPVLYVDYIWNNIEEKMIKYTISQRDYELYEALKIEQTKLLRLHKLKRIL